MCHVSYFFFKVLLTVHFVLIRTYALSLKFPLIRGNEGVKSDVLWGPNKANAPVHVDIIQWLNLMFCGVPTPLTPLIRGDT